eukprot:TRINITY_DN1072_c0_g1_i1.p1 TRINITY_DN1072_c0_g1~~TRINITY_DN1072_c0_g1_i1.p1  ORF type:complete len:405 (+),score=102.45 TRINITY_DN1072_c0_g1_i1:47-1261(+)
MSSSFDSVPLGPTDAILGITLAFRADPNPDKINVGVGAYRTEDGKALVLQTVKEAENIVDTSGKFNKEYVPIDGNPDYQEACAKLIFGDQLYNSHKDRIVTVQSLSGTGALRVGLDFLKKFIPNNPTAYVSDPTWPNHFNLFRAAGLPFKTYRYWDARNNSLDFVGMKEDIIAAPKGSIILLHACAHNPTGTDPTPEQWEQIADLIKAGEHQLFIDCAYQGFASGDLDRDARPIRMFLEKGFEFVVAQSFAKNMGLYGERTGALHVVCGKKEVAEPVRSQLKLIIRATYSSPPIHGAFIVTTILGNPELRKKWEAELKDMAGRIQEMRQRLHDTLAEKGIKWPHILNQIGMFGYTGMSKEQCEALTKKHHIYLTQDGRISLAGLTSQNIPRFANSVEDVTRSKL